MTQNKHGGHRAGAGRPPSDDPRQIKSVRLSGEEISRINKASARSSITASEFIRRAIKAALEKLKL